MSMSMLVSLRCSSGCSSVGVVDIGIGIGIGVGVGGVIFLDFLYKKMYKIG